MENIEYYDTTLEVFLVSVKLLKQMDDFKNCHLNQI